MLFAAPDTPAPLSSRRSIAPRSILKSAIHDHFQLQAHPVAIGNMQQARDSPDQVLLVLVDAAIGVTDAPEHFHDLQLVRLGQFPIQTMREFM
jgi:hypothetical protein